MATVCFTPLSGIKPISDMLIDKYKAHTIRPRFIFISLGMSTNITIQYDDPCGCKLHDLHTLSNVEIRGIKATRLIGFDYFESYVGEDKRKIEIHSVFVSQFRKGIPATLEVEWYLRGGTKKASLRKTEYSYQ